MSTLETSVYLVFEKTYRGYPKVRLANATTKQPGLKPGQRAMRIKVTMPSKMFEPAGLPTATIIVPEEAFSDPIPEVEVQPFEVE